MAEGISGKLSKQSIDRRRDLVKHLHYTGLSISLILQRLEKHDFLFPITADYDERYQIIASDIATIKKEAMESVAIDEYEVKQKHAEYIDRQNFLYHLSVQDGNLALARTISQDLARAYGIDTEMPVKVSVDIMSTLKNAMGNAQRKLEERKLIDITPQETVPDVQVKISADAILNKR